MKDYTEKAVISKIYVMTARKAKKNKLTMYGAHWFKDRVIVELKYQYAVQSTSLNPSKTALSLKKGDSVDVISNGWGTPLRFIKVNGRKLKTDWAY